MSGKVAFCVVSWNNAAVLPVCLDSLLAQTGVDFDIYLMDNGSTDETRSVMARYPGVRVTWSDTNHGFARGNNLLIKQALADPDVAYVALINSDAALDPAWAATLVAFAERHGRVGSLQGLTLDYYDHDVVDSAHIFVNKYLQGTQFGYGDSAEGVFYPRRVFGVNAAAAMYTRAMIEGLPDRKHDFFDERFFMYYEDVDVAYRALLAGWTAWFVPDAVAYHMGSFSAHRLGSNFSLRMTARNLPAMVFKNTPWPVLRRNFRPAWQQMMLFIEQAGVRHGPEVGRQTRRAFWRGLLRLPIYAASRRRIAAARVLDSNYLARIMRNDGIPGAMDDPTAIP